MKCKKCNSRESLSLDVWTYDEIGKSDWTPVEHKWFKDNEPLCDNCVKEHFKK